MSKFLRLAASAAAITLSLTSTAYAQENTDRVESTPTSPAASVETSGPALWKVADEDTTIYLFGTVHALPQGVEWYKGPVADALGSSDQLVTEIITNETTQAKMVSLVQAKGILPADQTLRGLLDEEELAVFDEAMGKLGLPVTAFDRFEPWYASMMLTMLPLMQQGYSADSGVENVLNLHAGSEKPRGELETIEWQIALFDELPQDKQVEFMLETAGMVDEIKPMLDEMVTEWLEGDADSLADLMNESMTDPFLADALLYSRNRNWAKWVDDRLEEPGTVFVAVGAGHLAGEQSVQDALEDRGIATVRVQ